MKKLSVILLLVLVGCVSTTKIDVSDPDHIVVIGASDELITYEDGAGLKVTSDRRGRPGIVESAVNLGVMKAVGEVTE